MKKIVSIFIILSLLLSLTACIGDKESYVIYYASYDKTGFTREKISVEKSDTFEGKIKNITEALLKGPKKAESSRVIPEDTALLGVRIEGKIVTLNLSQDFEKTKDDATRLLALYSLVNTLCEVEGIEGVKVLVNGRAIKYTSKDEEIGILSMNNVILADDIGKNQTVVLDLYFASDNKEELRLERRMVDIKDNDTLEKTAIDQLFIGSKVSGRKTLMPDLVKLLTVETKDKLCYVNFSKEFLSIPVSDAKLCIYQVVNTLTSLPEISAVQFFINGEKVGEVGGISLAEPFTYNHALVA